MRIPSVLFPALVALSCHGDVKPAGAEKPEGAPVVGEASPLDLLVDRTAASLKKALKEDPCALTFHISSADNIDLIWDKQCSRPGANGVNILRGVQVSVALSPDGHPDPSQKGLPSRPFLQIEEYRQCPPANWGAHKQLLKVEVPFDHKGFDELNALSDQLVGVFHGSGLTLDRTKFKFGPGMFVGCK